MTQTDVLVVGAGPTGQITLACDPARRGVAVRIVDRAPEFPGGPRGKGLSPRSLEMFDDLAVIDRILASGITHLPHREYRGAEVIAEIDPEAGQAPTPDIPYPAGLMISNGGGADPARTTGRLRRCRRTGRRGARLQPARRWRDRHDRRGRDSG